ncbi:hypothetical protein ACJMK2_004904 [Sinanodonta woodiana]|uniref:Uncharacterized protein n=1 Tax=Sinanodonta woodiana TaxID=1069815 RepID=A0ABD3VQ05_SINWO
MEIIYNVCRNPKRTATVSLGNVNVASERRISEKFIRNELRNALGELQEDVKWEKNNYVIQHGFEQKGLHLCRDEMHSHRRHLLATKDLNEVFDTSFIWGNANDQDDIIFKEISSIAMMVEVFKSTTFGCCSVTMFRGLHRRVQSALSYTHKLFKVLKKALPIGDSCLQNITLTLEDCTDAKDAGFILLHHMEQKLSHLI